MFTDWFGKYAVKTLPKDIQEEIKTLSPKSVTKLKKSLKRFIAVYASGKKNLKADKFSLESIIIAQNIVEELQSDALWKQYKKNKNLQQITEIVTLLNSSELTETHMHVGQSTEMHIHWAYFKKFWQQAVAGKNDFFSLLNEYETKGKLFSSDVKKLNVLMKNFLSGKYTETKTLLVFRDILIMRKRAGFTTFCKKADLFNLIDEQADKEKITSLNNLFVMMKFRNIAAYCKNQNITYAEIRLGGGDKQAAKKLVACLKKVQKEFGVSLKLITFSGEHPKTIMAMHKSLSKQERSFIVGMDLMRFADSKDIITYAKQVNLPLCVHAGEFYGKNELGFNGLSSRERLKRSYLQILRSAKSKGIARIGHATSLVENITSYVGKRDIELEKLRKKTIAAIKKNNVIIEANPTSNSLIAHLKYKNHPIKIFLKEGIKFTISTDDRVTFNTNLKREFVHVALALNLSVDQIKEIIETGTKARLSA